MKRSRFDRSFELLHKDDVTNNVVDVSRRWHSSRLRHRDELVAIEGEESFDGLQELLLVTNRLSIEGWLSRFFFAGREMTA